MGDAAPIPVNERARLLAEMQTPFYEKLKRDLPQLQGLLDGDLSEAELRELWRLSVTNGSETYGHYRQSLLWRTISSEILQRDRHVCAGCGGDAFEVHHRNYRYEAMAGLDDAQLLSLCRRCHLQVHFHRGKKLSARAWDKRLRGLQKHSAGKGGLMSIIRGMLKP